MGLPLNVEAAIMENTLRKENMHLVQDDFAVGPAHTIDMAQYWANESQTCVCPVGHTLTQLQVVRQDSIGVHSDPQNRARSVINIP